MRSFVFILILIGSLPCMAQKAYKPMKAALKAKNYKEAVSQIGKLRADSAYADDPKLCVYSIEANRGLNDAENMKLYLKKSYDTVAFFSTTREIIREAVRLDSIENSQLDSAAAYKYKRFAMVSDCIKKYYPNLKAAGLYFYRKGKYEAALPHLRTNLDLCLSALGGKVLNVKPESPQVARFSVLYTISAYNHEDYGEVSRYARYAMQDTLFRPAAIECQAFAAKHDNDSTAYHDFLQMGMDEYPQYPVFFTHLSDYYAERGQFRKMLDLAQKQARTGFNLREARTAECISRYSLSQYDSCRVAAVALLEIDSANVDAHYYIGASWVGKAQNLAFPEYAASAAYRKVLKEQNSYYAKAEPELELYRESAPDAQDLWAPLLYKVYFALNRGKKFEEIEKLLLK